MMKYVISRLVLFILLTLTPLVFTGQMLPPSDQDSSGEVIHKTFYACVPHAHGTDPHHHNHHGWNPPPEYPVECPEKDFYGPKCDQHCQLPNITQGEYYFCSPENGTKICCPNFYHNPKCDVFCMDGDTYTCDSNTGWKVCHENWYGVNCHLFCNISQGNKIECNWVSEANQLNQATNNTFHCSCRQSKSPHGLSKLKIGAMCSVGIAVIFMVCTLSLTYKLHAHRRSSHGTLNSIGPAAVKTLQIMADTSGGTRNNHQRLVETNSRSDRILPTPTRGAQIWSIPPAAPQVGLSSPRFPPGFEQRKVVENHYVEDNVGIRRVIIVDFGYVDMTGYLEHDYRAGQVGRGGDYHHYAHCYDVPDTLGDANQ